jgi:hypothetical protein
MYDHATSTNKVAGIERSNVNILIKNKTIKEQLKADYSLNFVIYEGESVNRSQMDIRHTTFKPGKNIYFSV